MKKNKLTGLSILLTLAMQQQLVAQQIEEPHCDIIIDTIGNPEAIGSSTNGEVFTPKGNLRVLTIFAGFDDNTGPFNENQPLENWGDFSPSDPAILAIPTPLMINSDKWMYDDLGKFGLGEFNLSEYYDEMSLGQFKFYGDILKDPITNQFVRIDIDPTGLTSWGGCNNRVIQKMQQLYPNFDWSPYDNRTNKPNFQSDNSISPPDNKPDYVIIVYRYSKIWSSQPVPGMQFGTGGWIGSGGAYSVLNGIGVNYNGYTFDNAGFTLPAGSGIPEKRLQIFIHELAHELYSSPHQNNDNGTVGKHWNFSSTGWGMMGSILNLTAYGWDRWMLGWIDLKAGINQDNTGINSPNDLVNNGIYTLRDFTTTGDVIRIKIPYTTNQFIWIENHQNFSQFDHKPWAGLGLSPNGEIVPEMSYGLYMYKENIHDDRDNASTSMIFDESKVNGIYLINASGNYDYERSDFAIQDWNWFWNNPIFNFKRNADNPIDGYNTYQLYIDDFPNPVTNGTTDGVITYTGDFNMGASESYFMIRENDVINDVSTFSSTGGLNNEAANLLNRRTDVFIPNDEVGISGIVPLLNYPIYDKTNAKKEPFIINGLTVKVLSQNSVNGDITVQVMFDDVDVRNDKRWTGNIEVREPLYSTYSLNLKASKILDIDKSGTPNRHTLSSNNDFINPTRLTCESGSYFHVEQNATVNVQNNSTLHLKSGSKMELESGARLHLFAGTTLIIDDGAELNLKPGAVLEIDRNATVLYNNNQANKGLLVGATTISGNPAKVEVKGKIIFDANATWVHNRDGYYHFFPVHQLIIPSTVVMNFTGKGKTLKFIELAPNTTLMLENIAVTLNVGMIFYNFNTHIYLDNVALTSVATTYNPLTNLNNTSTGLIIENPVSFFISTCDFNQLQNGITVSNGISLTPYTLQSTKFNTVLDKCVQLANVHSLNITGGVWQNANMGVAGSADILTITNTEIKSMNYGVHLSQTPGAYFNNANIHLNNIGIFTDASLVFLRNGTKVHDNVGNGIEMYGVYSSVTRSFNSMLTVGDLGCGSIFNNYSNGVYAKNTILNIDAIQHSINRGDANVIPNQFYGNTNLMFDICYSSGARAPSQINAKGNYWGASVITPSEYSIVGGWCPGELGSPQNIALVTTSHSTCFSATSCMNCASGGGGGGPSGGLSNGTTLQTTEAVVEAAFTGANTEFLVEDNMATRNDFINLSAIELAKDTLTNTWFGTSISNQVFELTNKSVHHIQVAKAIKASITNANARENLMAVDIFKGISANSSASIQLYPNPVSDELTINFEQKNDKEIYTFIVYSISGQLLLEKMITVENNTINVSELKEGLYLYEMLKPNGTKLSGKFSISKN